MMPGELGTKATTIGLGYCSRYGDFVIAMAYGEKLEVDVALASVTTH